MRVLIFFLGSLFLVSCSATQEQRGLGGDLVDSILQSMTLEEKVGQMVQLNVEMFVVREEGELIRSIRLDTQALIEAIQEKGVGSIMNTAGGALTLEEWRTITQTIKYYASPEQGGKIPVIYAFDAVHGANYVSGSTLFPHQLGMAATWNDSLISRFGEATAEESRAAGVHWVFSPILDVARQPLWVQFFETFGEDTYLAGRLSKALVRGYQESDSPVAACAKHYVGYGFPFSGKDRTPVHIGERTLREVHLPAFKKAIDAGLKTVMVGSNEIDGRPVLANKYWLNDVLRDELGFEGVVLSDWADVAHLADWHRIAEDNREAAYLAVEAGLDMAMVPNDYSFVEDVLALVESGVVSEERIEASVRRILQLKWDMGLFRKSTSDAHLYHREGNKMAAFQSALESITLLKNEGDALPLDRDEPILVIGPAANSMSSLNGAWSRTWQGTDSLIEQEGHLTLVQSMREHDPDLRFLEMGELGVVHDLKPVEHLAKTASAIVLCLGETPATEKPGDIRDLELDELQLQLAERVLSSGKPVVLVLLEDRPRVVSQIAARSAAVIMAYRPGSEGGRALSDLLYGKENFSGKLPFTYPSAVNDLTTYDHKHAETIGPDWGPTGFRPQWEFGLGLSYTEFEYSDLQLEKESYGLEETIELSVVVKNTGDRSGKEVVQVYIRDEIASITPPVKRLRDFQKIELALGEERRVSFSIPVEDLAFVGMDGKWIVEPGWFTVMVGGLEAGFIIQ